MSDRRRQGRGLDFELLLARLPRNDIGNVERFILRCGRDFKWTEASGWRARDGRRWDGRLAEMRAKLAAQEVAAAIELEAAAMLEAGSAAGERQLDLERQVAAHHGWAVKSGNSHHLDAMLQGAALRLSARRRR